MEVGRAARQQGFDSSDRTWLARSAARPGGTKALVFFDLTFRGGRLAGYKETTYDPRTKKSTTRDVDLCGSVR